MSLASIIAGCAFAALLIAWILFIVFGQVTVRKLRKNPETMHELGVELASGWDIFNVAQALTLPKSWTDRMAKSRLSFMEANAQLLRQHTTQLDRILARCFYILFVSSGVTMFIALIFT